MAKNIKDRIENDIELNKDSVWMLADKKQINYSDGRSSERYLEKVFLETRDLSSTSYELEKNIKDWPSEYYLIRKRSQLLRGFSFDKSKKVLEVGCGCGSITRFLGETFDEVVAVEGSLARARLARLRTRDLKNVSILCAPFQEVKIKERFDIIFCIGVFEYSNMFVNAVDPFDSILKYFHNALTPEGEIIIAIENQFGLKYFSSSREDHNNIMFDGLEGYSHYTNKEKTFGYDELKCMLEKHFAKTDFYFPYPDYKLPSCILSEQFFNKVKAAELIGNCRASSYLNSPKPLFDERLVLFELEKNNKLPFFSNSFIVIAGKQNKLSSGLKELAVVFGTNRVKELQTITKFVEHEDGSIWVEKTLLNGADKIDAGMLTLYPCKSKWIENTSIHTRIMQKIKKRDITIKELFAESKIWFETLKASAVYEKGEFLLDGKYIDCIWSNSYISNGKCVFIDNEWEWHEKINLNILLIRSIFSFLDDISEITDLNQSLKINSQRYLIKEIAKNISAELTEKDFKEFIKLELEIMKTVYGKNSTRTKYYINIFLWNRALFFFILFNTKFLSRLTRKIHNIILQYF